MRVVFPSGAVVDCEVASTIESQRLGLMFRKGLPFGKGMMFPFQGAAVVRSMWMLNVPIPLDMVFFFGDWIGMIHPQIPPESTALRSSIVPCTSVLEVPGGYCESAGILQGQTVTFLNP